MKKQFVLMVIMLIVLLTGCSSSVTRTSGKTIALNSQKDLQVTFVKTISKRNSWLKSNECGVELKIKNCSNDVKYINWSSSSLSYNNFTSRIVTGSDKIINSNSIVPNTAVLPNREITVMIFAADAINIKVYPAATYVEVSPSMDESKEIDLILSYSGNDINKLLQAVYKIEL